MSDNAIELTGVSREYRMGSAPIRALEGLNFAIPKATMVAVVGPSGSGKSTLLNLLGALDRPTSGEVVINGINLGRLKEEELTAHRRKTVGFVFQDFGLIPNLTALENVMLPMEFARVPRDRRRRRAGELLEAVRLSDRARHRPSKLSGGEQQRVAIARALANDPSIILADEPTGNLDSKTGLEIVGLLKAFVDSAGKTVVLVTHDETLAEIAHVRLHIVDGKVSQG